MDALILEYLVAMGLGAFGGAIRALMATDATLKQGITDVILGAASGLVFKFSGAPNHAGTFFAGYGGSHFISKAYEKATAEKE